MVVSVFYFQCFLMKTNVILGINQVASCSLTLHNPRESLEPYITKPKDEKKTVFSLIKINEYKLYIYTSVNSNYLNRLGTTFTRVSYKLSLVSTLKSF